MIKEDKNRGITPFMHAKLLPLLLLHASQEYPVVAFESSSITSEHVDGILT